jgi:hypothetical protein
MPAERDSWLDGEYEEHLSPEELEAQRETFEELGRIQEEEGLQREGEVPQIPIPDSVLNPPPSEFEVVGFALDISAMTEADIFRALCKLFGDDPEEVIEEIRREDDDGEEWLRERGISDFPLRLHLYFLRPAGDPHRGRRLLRSVPGWDSRRDHGGLLRSPRAISR